MPREDESIKDLLKIREKAIEESYVHRRDILDYDFQKQKFSPRTMSNKKKDLEVWVTKQRQDIKESKIKFEEEWEKTQKILESAYKEEILLK